MRGEKQKVGFLFLFLFFLVDAVVTLVCLCGCCVSLTIRKKERKRIKLSRQRGCRRLTHLSPKSVPCICYAYSLIIQELLASIHMRQPVAFISLKKIRYLTEITAAVYKVPQETLELTSSFAHLALQWVMLRLCEHICFNISTPRTPGFNV